MVQNLVHATSTQRVVARLYAEGWIDCSGLGFPALSQSPVSDMRSFILTQLHQAGGQMLETDLKLAALIFSIPTHDFQVHPQLLFTLRHLVTEGLIEIHKFSSSSSKKRKADRTIALTNGR